MSAVGVVTAVSGIGRLSGRASSRARSARALAAFAAAGLVLLGAGRARAATWTVCAAACTDTTIQAAYNGAAAGDTIELEGNVSEDDNFNRGINVTVESNNVFTWAGVAGGPTLQFQNGNNSTVTLDDLIMTNPGNEPVIDWGNNGTADVTVDVVASVLENTSTTDNAPIVSVTDANAQVISISQTAIVGNGSAGQYGVQLSGGINALAVSIENTLLYGFTGANAAAVDADNGNSWGGVSLQNDTLFDNAWGYYDSSTSANSSSYTTLVDNVFIDDSAGDIHFDTTNATVQDEEEGAVSGNVLGDQTGNANFGAGNIYLNGLGLTTAQEADDEFVSPFSAVPNLHEIAGAWSICAAIDNALMPATDKDNNVRPSLDCSDGVAGDTNGGGYDIGAYQYTGPAASPTQTATVTQTFTATLSETFTVGPSATLTATPTVSPTVTVTLTPGATPEPTATPLPFALTPHYPNPDPAGSSGVYLPYTISDPAYVTVRIYDVAGEQVRSWSSDPELQAAGTYQRYWDLDNSSGKETASGVFLVQIDAISMAGDKQEAWEKCAVAR